MTFRGVHRKSDAAQTAVLALIVLVSHTSSAIGQMIRRLDGTTISAAYADSFARRTLADAHVTGAQVAVLNDGKLVWSAAFGRRREPDLPMDRETNTWAASITKSVFATYVMQLVERGAFDLDQPIERQLARPLDQYTPYKETGTALVHEAWWPTVTPRMLLSHSSGLANFAFLEQDKKMHLRFKPGSQFLYSGEGINLLQFVIEERLHQPLDTLMQAAIFGPLGMHRTGLTYSKSFETNVADRFDLHDTFHAETRRFPARAAGSMATSADDLSRFLTALFDGRIISATTRAAMLKPYLPIHALHQFPVAANEPPGTEADAVGLAYAAGWGVLATTRFGRAFFKEGHGDGAQNYLVCFERSRDCMIILTNSDNGEFTFRPLLETILGDTVTPWEWEGYTRDYIMESRKHQ